MANLDRADLIDLGTALPKLYLKTNPCYSNNLIFGSKLPPREGFFLDLQVLRKCDSLAKSRLRCVVYLSEVAFVTPTIS